ncbi:30S ribosomal protein S20 [Candidatus Roizmanbacteria bacterium]|nr:30S ribosomal protein S20 [Candidatus Roizmanbacteria bacterium]
MPNIQSAKKKVRKDVKKTARNDEQRLKVKKTVKKIVKTPKTAKNAKELNGAYSTIDKAAKKKVIHKNKAARLKAKISKLFFGKK